MVMEADRVGGFGLHLVESIADDWGYEPGHLAGSGSSSALTSSLTPPSSHIARPAEGEDWDAAKASLQHGPVELGSSRLVLLQLNELRVLEAHLLVAGA